MKNIDWNHLSFGYMKCNTNVRIEYKNGEWGSIESHEEDTFPIHIAATCLHYGAEAFEGLKAFCGADGVIRLFRPYDNARRMNASARRLCMAELPEELFVEACERVVKENMDFVPPYGSGASLYLRPLLIGTNAALGIHPATEFLFVILVSPVGAYFKGGMTCIDVMIDCKYDRAAPRGTGAVKAGGNYGASLYPGEEAHKAGFSNVLYLDAAERKYVEECGAANFFGVRGGSYITPKSESILPSITNMSLRTIAEEVGLKVEQRVVSYDELSTFEECGACGTAAVISPIKSIFNPENGDKFEYGEEVGTYCKQMYNKLQDIQYGRCADDHNWTVVVK